MSKAPPAKLGSTIVVKGQAQPVTAQPIVSQAVPRSVVDVAPPPEATLRARAPETRPDPVETTAPVNLATKSMTVKVDVDTYKKLKSHGIVIDKTSQDIFVAALAMYFKANKL
jgi:hypothetical protein